MSGTATGVVTNNSGLANAVLTIGNSANSHNPTPTATFSGVIQDGSGGNTLALTKAGGGTQILAATNTYTGPTVVNAGTLSLAATGSIAAGSAVTVNANGILAGTGNAFGSVELKSSGAIAPGTTATTGTLNVGSVQFDGGSIYSFKIKDAGDVGMAIPPITDSLLSTGAITLDSATVAPGNAVVIKLSSFGAPPTHFNSANNYSWQLAQGSALAGVAFDPSLFSVNSIGFKGASPFASFNVSNPNPGVLQLNYVAGTAPANLSWVGPLGTGGDGSWDPAGGTNWNDGVMNTGWNSANAADFNQGSGTVTLSAPISVPFIKFDVDGYTIAGTGGNTLSATTGFKTLAVQVTNAGQTGTISASDRFVADADRKRHARADGQQQLWRRLGHRERQRWHAPGQCLEPGRERCEHEQHQHHEQCHGRVRPSRRCDLCRHDGRLRHAGQTERRQAHVDRQ